MGLPRRTTLYVAELCGCATLREAPAERVMAVFRGSLEGAGATVVDTLVHQFDDGGLTCVLVLAESHAVLHTWPETGTVNVDIFACSATLEGLVAIAALGREFSAATLHIQEIPRAVGHAPLSIERT